MDKLTHEELTYLQDSLTSLRALVFGQLLEAKHRSKTEEVNSLNHEWRLIRSIRDKLYAENGRDTLALTQSYREEDS